MNAPMVVAHDQNTLDRLLREAVSRNDFDAVQELLERGANPEAPRNPSASSVDSVPDKGAFSEIKQVGDDYDKSRRDANPVMRPLLKSYANLPQSMLGQLKEDKFRAWLSQAIIRNDASTLRRLLRAGLHPSVTNNLSTLLHNAVRGGYLTSVQVLLEHGADPLAFSQATDQSGERFNAFSCIEQVRDPRNNSYQEKDPRMRLLLEQRQLYPHQIALYSQERLAQYTAEKAADDFFQRGRDLIMTIQQNTAVNYDQLNEAIKVAREVVMSPQEAVRKVGIKLFFMLFEQEQGFAEGARIANDAINTYDGYQNAGEELFKALFKRKQGFEEAFQAVRRARGNVRDNIQANGRTLIKMLVDAGYSTAFPEAAEQIQHDIRDSSIRIQVAGIELLSTLIRAGYEPIFAEGAQIAVEASKNPGTLSVTLTLIETLATYGHGSEETIISIIKNISGYLSSENKELIIKIWCALVEKGYEPAFEEAASIAIKHKNSSRYDLLPSVLKLSKALVEKKYRPIFETAKFVAIAKGSYTDDNPIDLEILSALTEQGYEPVFEDAALVAIKKINDMYEKQRLYAFKLFEALAQQDQGREEAEKLLKIPLARRSDQTKAVLRLYGIEEAPLP